jgi:hypothetical protein
MTLNYTKSAKHVLKKASMITNLTEPSIQSPEPKAQSLAERLRAHRTRGNEAPVSCCLPCALASSRPGDWEVPRTLWALGSGLRALFALIPLSPYLSAVCSLYLSFSLFLYLSIHLHPAHGLRKTFFCLRVWIFLVNQ